MMQPQVVLLKEGTDTSQGVAQLISNINACTAVVDTVATSLGPRGADKLVYSGLKTTITNDGATIMRLLDIVHPAAQTLVAIARSQDEEVGDGTTSVVLLAGELLKEAKSFIEDGVHPFIIIKGFRTAVELAKKKINELSVKVDSSNDDERRNMLQKCAATALNSKLLASHREFFAKMCVDAISLLDNDLDLDLVGVCTETGGTLEDSRLVEGVAFKKTFSYAGFEQQPKHFENPKILLLNLELELKAEKENAEVRVKSPEQYQAIVEAEWGIIYDKLEKIVKSDAKIVLSRLAIGDLATQYFADRGIFCAGRVPQKDLSRVAKACGGAVQTSVNDLIPEVLGTCEKFDEEQIGKERYNVFSGCVSRTSCTLLLRGGGEQFNDEAARSLHDALMIVKRAVQHAEVVPGGGAIEMELSRYLRDHAKTIRGKQLMIISAFAKALEVIPRQVSANAGFDATDIMNRLRHKHAQEGGQNFGVDVRTEGICDTLNDSAVWEPALVKTNALTASVEAACLILSIDHTVKNPKASQEGQGGGPGGPPGMGMMR